MLRVATDVGGTFTDLVFYDVDEAGGSAGVLGTAKADSTPSDFAAGIMATLAKAGISPRDISFFAHGSTVVINALTERTGTRTGLITTRGFRDVLEIARGNRPDLFNFMYAKPKPFVPRYLRREVTERVTHKGEVLQPVLLEELGPILELFRQDGVGAIAVCLLHAYANPVHETAVVARIRALWPEVSVVASHAITREWREYERTSTSVLAAYVHPVASRYLDRLEGELRQGGFQGRPFVMQSSGGISSFEAARQNPIALVESGPASGVLGAVALGRLIGEPNIITLDIGGTTAKCALVEDGRPRITTEYRLERTRMSAGYPIKVPIVNIVEIGSGGGSIAWVDDGGKLRVGPRSAGAVPGPAAYGRGGEDPTTTDAHLVTGRIDREYFLGGAITPDMDSVDRAFRRLGVRMGLTVGDMARGVIRVANASMVNALKLVSINRGHDPRDFALVAFGGGGAMHAAALARELGIPRLIIPMNPAVFSALGMLSSDMRRDYLLTRLVTLDAGAVPVLGECYEDMERRALADYRADGVGASTIMFERLADMRYQGQEHTVKVRFPEGAVDAAAAAEAVGRFHVAHEREFKFRLVSPVIVVNFHLIAMGMVAKPEPGRRPRSGRRADDAMRGRRRVDLDVDGIHDAAIYERAHLEPDMVLDGPAIVEEPDATIVVLPGQRARVDDFGNLHVSVTATPRGTG